MSGTSLDSTIANRLGFIDSLRGLAALAVAVAHFIIPTYGYDRFIFSHLLDPGKIAVTIFFIISGFIIPFSLKEKNGGIPTFIISRFFRLYPAYWASLFLYILVANKFGVEFSSRDIIANISMLQAGMGIPDVVGVYWTLFIELFFYAMCVGLFYVGLLNKVTSTFYLCIAMVLCALFFSYLRYITKINFPIALFLGLSLMFFGMLWRLYLLESNKEAFSALRKYIILLFLLLPIICFFSYGDEEGHALRYSLTYYMAVGMFILFTKYIRIQGKYMISLGVISYSIYLFHPSVHFVFKQLSKEMSNESRYIYGSLGIVISVLLSIVVYKLIEKPSINFGHRLRSRVVSRKIVY